MYYMVLNFRQSKLRERLLAYYFSNPEVSHYVRELSRILKVDSTNLSRELQSLSREGIFMYEEKGQQKYFRIDKSSPIFKELKSIILKTIGVEGAFKEALRRRSDVDFAIIYGSFAKGQEDMRSDVDVLVVGDINFETMSDIAANIEHTLKRDVNIKLYSKEEFLQKKKSKDPFLISVLEDKYILIKNKI